MVHQVGRMHYQRVSTFKTLYSWTTHFSCSKLCLLKVNDKMKNKLGNRQLATRTWLINYLSFRFIPLKCQEIRNDLISRHYSIEKLISHPELSKMYTHTIHM